MLPVGEDRPVEEMSDSSIPKAALLRALSHATRRRILGLMVRLEESGQLSPVEASEALDLPLTSVAYHFRVLSATSTVGKADQRQVRGTVQHFYRMDPVLRSIPWVLGLLTETASAD